jgi:hypothetical protein
VSGAADKGWFTLWEKTRSGQGRSFPAAFTLLVRVSGRAVTSTMHLYQHVGQFGYGSVYFGCASWKKLEKLKEEKEGDVNERHIYIKV